MKNLKMRYRENNLIIAIALISSILLGLLGLVKVNVIVKADMTISIDKILDHQVPDLFGMSISDANESLSKSGMNTVVIQYSYSPIMDKGLITAQSEPAGTSIDSVETIFITVSKGISPMIELDMDIPENHDFEYLAAQEYKMFEDLNEYRRENGLAELTWDRNLYISARWKAEAMGQFGYLAHTNPQFGGLSFKNNLLRDAFGYEYKMAGENLASDVIEGNDERTYHESLINLKASPSHNDSMLSKEFTSVGIGIICIEKIKDDGTVTEIIYVVQHFGK